jgi:hypothetical protein
MYVEDIIKWILILLLLRWGENVSGAVAADNTWVSMGQRRSDIDRGKPKDSQRNLSQCQFPTTNPAWAALGANLVLHGEKPASNRLSYMTRPKMVLKEVRRELHEWLRIGFSGGLLRTSQSTVSEVTIVFFSRTGGRSMHQSHVLWLGREWKWEGGGGRKQGNLEHTVVPNVALCNVGFQWQRIVLLNVFASK